MENKIDHASDSVANSPVSTGSSDDPTAESTPDKARSNVMTPPEPKAETAAGQPGELLSNFDLKGLRLPQDSASEEFGAKRLLTRIPVGKPAKTEFFRVRSGAEWQFPASVLELKEERETYVIGPRVRDCIAEVTRAVVLHVAIDRHENLYVLPVPLPGHDGRRNPWHESLALVVSKAEKSWIRCVANLRARSYDAWAAESKIPDPEWPDLSLSEILKIAFRDRIVDSPDDPVISAIRGRC